MRTESIAKAWLLAYKNLFLLGPESMSPEFLKRCFSLEVFARKNRFLENNINESEEIQKEIKMYI